MLKYVTIPDIRRYPSYANVNARLLYFHVAMAMDISSRTYAHSWRQLSQELDIPLQQLRTALKQLERDGLVVTRQVTQQVTYGITQRVTHKVTEIYIVNINELDEATNEATNSPTNSPTNSQSNSQSNSQKNNINTPKSSKASLTDARVAWADMGEKLSRVLHLEQAVSEQLVSDFRQRQLLKKKTWLDEGDLLAHLISWAEKHLGSTKVKTVTPSRSDSQSRSDEYARTKAAEQAKSQQEKDWEEVRKVWGWYQERLANKDAQGAEQMRQAYEELKTKYIQNYRQDYVQLESNNGGDKRKAGARTEG